MERAPVGSREFSLCTECWSQHRRKGKEEEEEEVKEDGGGAEECPQERMASPEVLSRQLQENIRGKPTTLPMLPTQNRRDRMDPPSEHQPGGQVVSWPGLLGAAEAR